VPPHRLIGAAMILAVASGIHAIYGRCNNRKLQQKFILPAFP
jgi:hypothetical protein